MFLSPQVKRCAIIAYKHGIYELPHRLPNEVSKPHGIFAAGGAYMPTQEKKKPHGIFAAGGGKVPTQEKKKTSKNDNVVT